MNNCDCRPYLWLSLLAKTKIDRSMDHGLTESQLEVGETFPLALLMIDTKKHKINVELSEIKSHN